jgi:hypothetical protein
LEVSAYFWLMGQFEFSPFMAQGWMPAFAGITTVDSTRSSAGTVIPAQAGIQQALGRAHALRAAGTAL